MKIEKLKITRVSITDKNKDGNVLIAKNGKPYFKVGIQTAQYADKWLNGLVFGEKPNWQEGEEVELAISEEIFNGEKKLKFDIPRREDKSLMEINALAIKVGLMNTKLDRILAIIDKPKVAGTDIDYPEHTEPKI